MSNHEHLKRFLDTGNLTPNACYYFDPPLNEMEMMELRKLFKNIKDSDIITNPLRYSGYNEIRKLLWFETDEEGTISGWQNPEEYRRFPDGSENEQLMTAEDVIDWFKRHGEYDYTTFIDSRQFLTGPVIDLFDQLSENRLNEIGIKRSKDTHIIYRDNNMVILVPLSFGSAKSFSRKTQYCTGGDCSRGSEKTSKDMFKQHTSKGDILYRIFFKDGTKARLTWNGDINQKDFHWGLGKKDSYPTFTSRNMSNPFDMEQIREIRLEQLELDFELEPRIKQLDEWEKKFASQWGWDVHDITDVFKKIRKKWGMPELGEYSERMSDEAWQKMTDEETRIYNIYITKKKEILGKYYGKTGWWGEGHELLYKAITRIPEGAITKMVEYASSGDYKPVNESEGEFDWVNELQPQNIDDAQLRRAGKYILKQLTLDDLRPGLFIKRKNGKFLYELGEELPISFIDANSEELVGEMGYMLINISNGKKYMGRKHQIIRDFYLIQSQ